jgi:hypothetical protein
VSGAARTSTQRNIFPSLQPLGCVIMSSPDTVKFRRRLIASVVICADPMCHTANGRAPPFARPLLRPATSAQRTRAQSARGQLSTYSDSMAEPGQNPYLHLSRSRLTLSCLLYEEDGKRSRSAKGSDWCIQVGGFPIVNELSDRLLRARAVRGNPGAAGCGAVIWDPQGEKVWCAPLFTP